MQQTTHSEELTHGDEDNPDNMPWFGADDCVGELISDPFWHAKHSMDGTTVLQEAWAATQPRRPRGPHSCKQPLSLTHLHTQRCICPMPNPP